MRIFSDAGNLIDFTRLVSKRVSGSIANGYASIWSKKWPPTDPSIWSWIIFWSSPAATRNAVGSPAGMVLDSLPHLFSKDASNGLLLAVQNCRAIAALSYGSARRDHHRSEEGTRAAATCSR